ncbi:MAG TPA: LexA family transcriptional regulator [Sphingobium sp.]
MDNYDSAELRERLKDVIDGLGTQKEAAAKTGIPYATLQRMLAGKSPITRERLDRIATASAIRVADLLGSGRLGDTRESFTHFPAPVSEHHFEVPALAFPAAAGNGSVIWGEELGHSPFLFAKEWLRSSFGSIAPLRLVQIAGDSQIPDLSDGDWVVVDTSKTKQEDGLAVLLLDDCLMIKRIQREGYFVQLLSRNTMYAPTVVDLSKEAHRLKVIGKVVYIFKGL